MNHSFVLEPLNETRSESGPIRLNRFPCTIGRSHDCDPRLNLHRISRRHLRLSLEDDHLVVEDLGSTNGTFVNDERVYSPTTLRPGDSLHIADYAFRLAQAAESGATGDRRSGEPNTLAGQTIAGFTEDPDGFPVQAPQLYELLNDQLLEPLGVEAVLGEERLEAVIVTGRSTHPALNAGHTRLVRMARQIGEEARYHGILREKAAQAADEAALDNRILVLPIDPIETEDVSVLLHELNELAGRYRRLELACEVDIQDADPADLEKLKDALAERGIVLAARAEDSQRETFFHQTGIAPLAVPREATPSPLDSFY